MEKIGYYTVTKDGQINATIAVHDAQNKQATTGTIVDSFAVVSEEEALQAFAQRGVTHIKFFDK